MSFSRDYAKIDEHKLIYSCFALLLYVVLNFQLQEIKLPIEFC